MSEDDFASDYEESGENTLPNNSNPVEETAAAELTNVEGTGADGVEGEASGASALEYTTTVPTSTSPKLEEEEEKENESPNKKLHFETPKKALRRAQGHKKPIEKQLDENGSDPRVAFHMTSTANRPHFMSPVSPRGDNLEDEETRKVTRLPTIPAHWCSPNIQSDSLYAAQNGLVGHGNSNGNKPTWRTTNNMVITRYADYKRDKMAFVEARHAQKLREQERLKAVAEDSVWRRQKQREWEEAREFAIKQERAAERELRRKVREKGMKSHSHHTIIARERRRRKWQEEHNFHSESMKNLREANLRQLADERAMTERIVKKRLVDGKTERAFRGFYKPGYKETTCMTERRIKIESDPPYRNLLLLQHLGRKRNEHSYCFIFNFYSITTSHKFLLLNGLRGLVFSSFPLIMFFIISDVSITLTATFTSRVIFSNPLFTFDDKTNATRQLKA